ncbi:MAG TPA: NAD(P)-dependent oxidoreductase, partial [Bacteroidales bacterium]|nr:NAD(P)-dependent oxidoreductase [Bacteroidales bacterium]
LVDREYIRHFHRPFWLINTSRGPVVSSEALAWALDEGRILGAGLDVLEYEKRSLEGLSFEDFPEAFRNLIARDNVIFSPHVAGWTDESLLRLAQVLAAKIKALDVA